MNHSRVGQPTGRGRGFVWAARILPLVAVAAALVAVSAASAARPTPSKAPAGQPVKLIDLASRQTTVVVQLAGDPVTVADANASAPLTDGQKDSLRSQLRAAQAPVENQVRSHGGQVLATSSPLPVVPATAKIADAPP